MLLAFALAHQDGLPPVTLGASDLDVPSVLRDPEAGLVSCRGRRALGWFSLRGQPVQGFSREDVELRLSELALDLERAGQRIVHGIELRQYRVAGVVYDTSAIFGHARIDQVEITAQGSMGCILVFAGQVAVAGDVGIQNRGQPARQPCFRPGNALASCLPRRRFRGICRGKRRFALFDFYHGDPL